MALVRDLSAAQIAFQIAGRDIDQFQAIRYSGTEGLCQLYRFEIDLAALEEGLAIDAIVGKAAALSINTSHGERWFHGIVSRFEMSGEGHGQTYFRAELVPHVWLLTHRYNSRIFQQKKIEEIITLVLTGGGIPSDRFRFALTRTYKPREYCVQYRETDYNFICRLMEEEGIFWYFEHTQEGHTLVMEDSNESAQPIEGEAALGYRPPSGMNVETEHIFRFRISQSVRPGAVVLNDFNFESPKLSLESKGDAARDPSLEFIDFPGKYTDQGRGGELANLRAEEFEASRITATGQTNCKRLTAGRTFELIEHPSAGFDGEYFVTSLSHQGKQATLRSYSDGNGRTSVLDPRLSQSLVAARNNENGAIRELAEALLQVAERLQAGDPTARRSLTQWLYHAGQVARDLPSAATASGGSPLEWLTLPNLIEDVAASSIIDYDAPPYECRFTCIKKGVAYRPPRVTPWPVMRGTQTARVVGPEGEEIHTDQFGRVKVQFHWDREGNEGGQPKKFGADSSCFIRVSQGMAGGSYGMMFLPRVGQEVVVDFLEGDPDQPIVVGRVYNADHMPPYKLPDEKTKSVIKTHSSKEGGGCNEIRFEDLKDKEQLLVQAQRQMDTRVKASHFHTIGGSYNVHVGGECNGQKQGDLLELVYRDKHVHVKQHLFTWVEGEEHRAIGGLQAVEIGGTRSWLMRQDAIDLFEANHQHEVTSTYFLKAADVKIEASGTIELVAGGSSIVISGSGIWIKGPMVYINSGSGPPVPPTAVAGMVPGQALDAGTAESTKPGKDTRYTGDSLAAVATAEIEEVPGHDFPEREPPSPTATHFIEIELLDETNTPVAGEPYEITTPDGKIRRGSTDANGHAKETGLEPGQCQIKFPRLDEGAWERA